MFSLLLATDSVRHTPGRPSELAEELYCPMCEAKKNKWVKRWDPKVHSRLANWCHDSLSKDNCLEFQDEVADLGAH